MYSGVSDSEPVDLFLNFKSETLIDPLVSSIKDLGGFVFASCSGHSSHEPGVLYTSEPFVVFSITDNLFRRLCAVQSGSGWSSLVWGWSVEVCDCVGSENIYRISPKKFQRGVESFVNSSFVGRTIGQFSRDQAIKRCWPAIRESLAEDVNRICKLILERT